MRGPRPIVVALVALTACGGRAVDDGASTRSAAVHPSPADDGASGPSGSSGQLVTSDEVAVTPPPTCAACSANVDCGSIGACVVSPSGVGTCAPYCPKDGFCTPDRVCQEVTDPTGTRWRACVSRAGTCEVPVSWGTAGAVGRERPAVGP